MQIEALEMKNQIKLKSTKTKNNIKKYGLKSRDRSIIYEK